MTDTRHDARSSAEVLAELWQAAALPDTSLSHVALPGAEPVLPSSFAVGTAAQISLAAAALAAAEVWHRRQVTRDSASARQQISVAMLHAALECCGHFSIDGRAPALWEKLSGLYPCGAGAEQGWVRIHANFAHHRDGALRLLGLPIGPDTERVDVEHALRVWSAQDFESAAAEAGLVVAAARSFDEWDQHPQARAMQQQPTVSIERIPGTQAHEPQLWPVWRDGTRPLSGLRVLDLTRILAGPVAGRTLAAYGADVMLVNSPTLPNIAAIADTSRGKLSAHVDLHSAAGSTALQSLLREANVFMQGYRPGGLAQLGFGPEQASRLRPGIVYVSLSAYGHVGPWSAKRGFDSLVQTATGFNVAEAQAAGSAQPKALPMQILDYAAGHLLAFGAQAALLRQAREGGSWHVRVSLAGVGQWLRSLGRIAGGLSVPRPAFEPYLEESDSGYGRLVGVRHAAQFSATPARWLRASMPPGSHPPVWPEA